MRFKRLGKEQRPSDHQQMNRFNGDLQNRPLGRPELMKIRTLPSNVKTHFSNILKTLKWMCVCFHDVL